MRSLELYNYFTHSRGLEDILIIQTTSHNNMVEDVVTKRHILIMHPVLLRIISCVMGILVFQVFQSKELTLDTHTV